MRLLSYVWNNITQKRGRTIFYLFGIVMSLISALDMQLLTLFYANATNRFFEPFEGYCQIVEKGTNYLQFFPTSSHINQSLETEFEQELEADLVPALFVSKKEALLTVAMSFVIGMHIRDIPMLWEAITLIKGRWPQKPHEMVVGNMKANKTQFTFYNTTFTVVGVLEQQFSYLDSAFILPLETLQQITGKTNQVNVFYVSQEVETGSEVERQFEAKYPSLELLTPAEVDELHHNVQQFTGKFTQILTAITSLSALIFVGALNLLSISNRKADFALFSVLGTPKWRVFLILWLENLILLVCGTLLACPLSFVVYSFIYTYITLSVTSSSRFWRYFSRGFTDVFTDFPVSSYFRTIGVILGGNLILLGIMMGLGLRHYQMADLKDKF